MRDHRRVLLILPLLLGACLGDGSRRTLASLRDVEPDLQEVAVDDGIDQAIAGYRQFLEEAPASSLTPEAMRRLADLKLEKEFGVEGGSAAPMPAPASGTIMQANAEEGSAPASLASIARDIESKGDFVERASAASRIDYAAMPAELDLPGSELSASQGPAEAIRLYDRILEQYPGYPHNDEVLYQKARALDELGRNDEAIVVTRRLVAEFPDSRHIDEVQFRRAEYFFTRKKYLEAEESYGAIVVRGPRSEYYELALYKLGWTLYKQMMLEEALDQYVALLDHKVASAYDFDQTDDEADQARIEDTYRVMSLCFSDLGGPEAVETFFERKGARSYEDRVYEQLAEFYFEKLRYADAASVYQAFVGRYPFHRESPRFSMRVVSIYEAGGFPKLVLESKKAFAADYGLDSAYWTHFDVQGAPEVVAYLKANLRDLATHYHAVYQQSEPGTDRVANFEESSRWYGAYLASFAQDPEAPSIHYRLADLLLENEDFGDAARAYAQTAYDYPRHDQAAAAGYASIFARRQQEKAALESDKQAVKRAAVADTLRFVDVFPEHEHAAGVLGAAVDDLFALEEFGEAIVVGRRLIERYPAADAPILLSAWSVVAHSSFETGAFEDAERAYERVLALMDPGAKERDAMVENLAASIYKQGERAAEAGDHRAAADHFLRVARSAPGAAIRPVAEYDAAAALIEVADWAAAAEVLEAFRRTHPTHELGPRATQQLAFVYREQGEPGRAAEEYARVAEEADAPDLRAESLLVAGGLFEEAGLAERALGVYRTYVTEFTHPIDRAVVTRSKMAQIHASLGDVRAQHAELRRIVEIDAGAGEERTQAVRVVAARAALTLAEVVHARFAEIRLDQPFERSLREKQKRMNESLKAMDALVDYEVAEVTAAATFYIAEVYADFSQALLDSERPSDLGAADLQDYEMALEEEAFPFEERAIETHEKNLELMSVGVYNGWIEKSLARLAKSMPGRYAKFESSGGPITSLETFVYRVPASLIAPPAPEAAAELAATDAGTVGGEPGPDVARAPLDASVVEGAEADVADGDSIEADSSEASSAAASAVSEDAPPAAPAPVGMNQGGVEDDVPSE